MTNNKGKAVDRDVNGVTAMGPLIPPMRNPSAGSANPSASFPALWNYIEPALDHIVRSNTNTSDKAPSIDVAYHMGIHTAVYNYFTSSRFDMTALAAARGGEAETAPGHPNGADLYDKLDKYYSDVCQELLANTPLDDTGLVHYLIPCFHRYSAGAQSVNRLLNYVNRHHVKRAVEEDRGWLRLSDILDAVAQTIQDGVEETSPREKVARKLREKRMTELKRWGFSEGGSSEDLAYAEAAAEAASQLDRIVPLSSMAHRRFREEVIKPLMAIPKSKGKGKKKYKKPPGATGDADGPGPKSRMARAAKEIIESKDADTLEGRKKLATELDTVLGIVGIPADHLLRKRLEKFCFSKG